MGIGEQLQQRGAEFLGGSGGTHVGSVSECNRPDWHGRRERHTTQLGSILENHAGDHRDPESRFDETEYRVHLASLDGKPWRKASALTGGKCHRSEVVTLPEHDQRVIAQIFDPKRVELEIHAARHGDRELLAQNRNGVQGGVASVRGRSDHRQVDGSLSELPDQVPGPALVDEELDAGVTPTEQCQGMREGPGAQAWCGT